MWVCKFYTFFSNSWVAMGTLQPRLGYFSVVMWAPHVSGSDASVCYEFVRLEAFRGRASASGNRFAASQAGTNGATLTHK
jgi:hypothetical protein